MFLKNISLLNFKNYHDTNFIFCPAVNCLTGNNGEGKTNLLDSIHYLSFCKSYFNPIDSHNIKHEDPFFVIQGVFFTKGEDSEVYCGQKRNSKKQFKLNKKEYSRLADHIGLFPVVMISPADADLINEGSEIRRRFIDSVISQFDKKYLDNLINYNRALSQRNALLKHFGDTRTFSQESLAIWDEKLIEFGSLIFEKRKQFIAELLPVFQTYYELISGGKEKVGVAYKSHLHDRDFKIGLTESIAKDKILEYTTIGVHKDDLEFTINDFPVKKYGSQGQQKSYLISLKLAEFEHIKKTKKITPILLLDDVYDKLDENRVGELMKLVSGEKFGQLFITDTHPARLGNLFSHNKIEFKLFKIKGGLIETEQAVEANDRS